MDMLRALAQPHVRVMLLLGFASGLPFLLSVGTLGAWLATAHIDVKTIGLMSLANIPYSLKFLWAPLVDNTPLPILHRLLGRRRSWMLASQAGIVAALAGLSQCDPARDLETMIWFAALLAFSSATQDIAIDAWRIEAARREEQPLMAGVTQLGYRLGLLTAGAGALYLATRPSWGGAYLWMAAAMGVGALGALLARRTPEPAGPAAGEETVASAAAAIGLKGRLGEATRFLYRVIGAPFVDFFSRNGLWPSILILLVITLYTLPDRVMGVMANPFYIHQGFTTDDIATVSKLYGIWIGIAGALLGGLIAVKLGPQKTLLFGCALGAASNLAFAWLATQGTSVPAFYVAITLENALGGFSGTALIAFLSQQTSAAFSGTQYALFSSFAALSGKLVGGLSGYLVEKLGGYFEFFVATALMGVPAVILVLVLIRVGPQDAAEAGTGKGGV